MNPQMLTLALDTPLEALVELPQAIRILTALRRDLPDYDEHQREGLLGCINGMIELAVEHGRRVTDDRDMSREDERDIEWLSDAIADQRLLMPTDVGPVSVHDYYRILSLYKLGCAIDAAFRERRGVLEASAVVHLLEALEALMMAELLPVIPPLRDEIDLAWHDGLTPQTNVDIQLKEAQSETARKAADKRHEKNRQAKVRAIELYFEREYASVEVAATIIAEQVFKAPRTVARWITEARKLRTPTSEDDSED